MQTRWTATSGWYDHILELDGYKLVYKQWFDSGKDPNRYDVPFHEFLAGGLHDELREGYGEAVLQEVVATVERLMAGGPGVAEPLD